MWAGTPLEKDTGGNAAYCRLRPRNRQDGPDTQKAKDKQRRPEYTHQLRSRFNKRPHKPPKRHHKPNSQNKRYNVLDHKDIISHFAISSQGKITYFTKPSALVPYLRSNMRVRLPPTRGGGLAITGEMSLRGAKRRSNLITASYRESGNAVLSWISSARRLPSTRLLQARAAPTQTLPLSRVHPVPCEGVAMTDRADNPAAIARFQASTARPKSCW